MVVCKNKRFVDVHFWITTCYKKKKKHNCRTYYITYKVKVLPFINYTQLVDINLFTYITINYMLHRIRILQLKLSCKNTNKPSSGREV